LTPIPLDPDQEVSVTATQYPVELKLTIAGQIAEAIERLAPIDGSPKLVWFLEDVTPGIREPLPLFSASLIIRLRTHKKRDDSTVKLRPARKSQLIDPWRDTFDDNDQEYRIEEDWAGPRRALAASYVTKFPPGTFAPLIAESRLLPAFREKQLNFLHDCAGIPVAIPALRPLGPITAIQWKDHDLDGISVNLERWTVGALDFLEVSARADSETEAVELQTRLGAAVSGKDLKVAEEQITKTRAVLEYLSRSEP